MCSVISTLLPLLWIVAAGVTGVTITKPETESAVYDAYDSVSLQCKDAKNNNMTWYKDGMQVMSDIRHFIVFITISDSFGTIQSKDISLVISDVTSYDAGVYRCQSNVIPDEHDDFTVAVRPAPVHIDEWRGNPLYVDARFGMRLSCRAEEDVTLVWSKDNRTVNTNDGYRFQKITERQLTILRLVKSRPTEDDSGQYTCSNADDLTDMDSIYVNVTNTDDVATHPTFSTPPQIPVGSATTIRVGVLAWITMAFTLAFGRVSCLIDARTLI